MDERMVKLFKKLGIPEDLWPNLELDAPRQVRLACAKGMIPTTPEAQVGICFILSKAKEKPIRAAAKQTLQDMPVSTIVGIIGQHTEPKLLEYLVNERSDQTLLEKILTIRNMNDQTAMMIAESAKADLCERIVYNQERLLITPKVFVALFNNKECSDRLLEKARSFLRMHKQLPETPEYRPWQKPEEQKKEEPSENQQLSNVTAPLETSKTDIKLDMFDLDNLEEDDAGTFDDFSLELGSSGDEDGFGFELTQDNPNALSDDERKSIETQIAGMSVGQKVKLAYLGNKEVRSILVRDRNKLVAVAVVRSGRLTDGEVAVIAGNRNLSDEVLREVAANREWVRKYPIKVALVNNPKTPPSLAVGLVNALQKKDLFQLTTNHNVSGVISTLSKRLYREKFRR